MKRPKKRALVIGLGNTLRSDDALGRVAASRVASNVDSDQVTVLSQCAPTPDLAADIAQAALVVFLDASMDGPTDQIFVRRLEPANSMSAGAHQLDAPSLLGLAGCLYGHIPEAVAVTFRGRTFDLSDARLSPEASVACDQLVSETLRLIDAHLSSVISSDPKPAAYDSA